jgi:DMSO/TMAO reductase YedYZ molybdopterin-dependent catalytic subunit
LAFKLKKTFMEIATTITVLFVLTSFTYNSIPPAKSATPTEIGWQLTVTGLVEKPLNLNWIEIVAMTRSSVEANLICVDFPGQIVMQGNWTGVKLRTLLEEAKPLPSAIKVGFYAADGYSTDLTAGTAMRDDIILAYEKDGFPLNDLRLVVPGKWGYKWISQLTEITLVNYDFLGRWESAGYSDEADISEFAPTPDDLKSSLPDPISTPPTTTAPSQSPSQPPTTYPTPLDTSTPTPAPSENMYISTETVYTIAVSLVAVVSVVGLMFVRKRKTTEKN